MALKEALALSLFTSILVLGAPDALAKSKHKKPTLSAGKAATAALDITKTALPEAEKLAKTSFFLAADPHVPLATVAGKAIQSVGKRGKECGAESRWAKPKSRWHAIDQWGRVTGLYEVKGAEVYDVTACREVSFAHKEGKPGAGLFVSEDSGYKPGEIAAFAPSSAEKKRFEKFLGSMESEWVNQKPLGKAVSFGKRTMFFQFAAPKDPSWEGRVDGAGKPIERPKRWAVAGGPILVVAYLGQNGRWKAANVKAPLGLADSYTPVAVFDMNGDGVPEIVYQSSDGPSYGDAVLKLNPETMTWEDAAESPGGGTL
jgi:hypothetical protein